MSSQSEVVNLLSAIKTNDIATVRSMLSKDPEVVRRFNLSDLPEGAASPLWEAMLLGHKIIVEMLIYSGANINELFLFKKDCKFYGLTFLHRLAFLNDDWRSGEKIAETLIRYGANVNAYYHPVGKTPFEIAIEEGNCSYVEFLMKNGAQILKKKLSFVKCPEIRLKHLYMAFISMVHVLRAPKVKQVEILQLMMKFCLDAGFRYDTTGYDHLHFNIFAASQWPSKVDIVGISKIFLNCGLPVNSLDKDGISPLIRAVNLQNTELVSLLIKRGAEVNFKSTYHGISALRTAAYVNNTAILDILLSNGAEIDIKCDYGWTAMHLVCYRRNENSINFLLLNGAGIGVENNNGQTPFIFLEPHLYKESDVACINIMLKEFAKLKFSDDLAVSKKDMDLIQSHPAVLKYFQNCMEELLEMSKTKFQAGYTYYYILKISKNVKKIANLTKNEPFVTDFIKNVHKFSHYEKDLRKIMEDAIKIRNESLIVNSRLKTAFDNYLPDVVMRKLSNNLKVKDLPLQPIDVWKCDRGFIYF